jgi:hypothetical protein
MTGFKRAKSAESAPYRLEAEKQTHPIIHSFPEAIFQTHAPETAILMISPPPARIPHSA